MLPALDDECRGGPGIEDLSRDQAVWRTGGLAIRFLSYMAWAFAVRSQLTLLRLRTSPSLPWLERSLLDAVHPATLTRPALTVRGEDVRRLRRLTHAADGFADLPPPPLYEVSAEGGG